MQRLEAWHRHGQALRSRSRRLPFDVVKTAARLSTSTDGTNMKATVRTIVLALALVPEMADSYPTFGLLNGVLLSTSFTLAFELVFCFKQRVAAGFCWLQFAALATLSWMKPVWPRRSRSWMLESCWDRGLLTGCQTAWLSFSRRFPIWHKSGANAATSTKCPRTFSTALSKILRHTRRVESRTSSP